MPLAVNTASRPPQPDAAAARAALTASTPTTRGPVPHTLDHLSRQLFATGTALDAVIAGARGLLGAAVAQPLADATLAANTAAHEVMRSLMDAVDELVQLRADVNRQADAAMQVTAVATYGPSARQIERHAADDLPGSVAAVLALRKDYEARGLVIRTLSRELDGMTAARNVLDTALRGVVGDKRQRLGATRADQVLTEAHTAYMTAVAADDGGTGTPYGAADNTIADPPPATDDPHVCYGPDVCSCGRSQGGA